MGAITPAEQDQLILHEYAENAYLQYAMAVVRDRALPQVEDGQKPVQRRILYTMRQLGLGPGARPVKCARIVGEVLGRVHPHGDTSVYDTLARMAQDFTLRYPLIIGQGNFGSRDGDPPAAYRYTEAKLAPISDLLLAELDQGTVDFVPNYDNTVHEPSRLPARLPFVLLNGSMGIAVGMACDIPPHNLGEVAAAASLAVSKPGATVEELLALMPGPDFPDGGHVISAREEIAEAYRTGRGLLRARARWRVEDLARGQWRVVVHELPYQVSTKRVLEELDALSNPQPAPGKKSPTQGQLNLKQVVLNLVERASDESGQKEKIRLVIEPRTSKVDPAELMTVLFAHTSLESSFSVNCTMLGSDGRPRQKALLDIVTEWARFRVSTVIRRTRFQLDRAEGRLHILDGRHIAFLNIEKVIRVIREAEDPKAELMKSFELTPVQADDILEIRLRQLARLEGIRIEQERKELVAERARLQALLASDRAIRKLIVREIEADAAKYSDSRRTLLEPVARTAAVKAVISVPDEPVTIVISRNGWIRSRPGHGLDVSTLAFKTGDHLGAAVETRTTRPVVIMDSMGRAYAIDAHEVPAGRGDGVPITSLITLQEGGKARYMLAAETDTHYLFANTGGYGYIAPFSALVSRNRAGKAFMSLEQGETLLPPVVVSGAGDDLFGKSPYVACAASQGKLLCFAASELKVQDRGRGTMLMQIDAEERLVWTGVYHDTLSIPVVIRGKQQQLVLKGQELARYVLRRARRGALLPRKALPVKMA
ncbi:MAG: DNA topoisomerase IV subunit A [Pseudomonadota bacterium]|nr:DNA topoisomerase IV subunit A [Pseudomonadota bacterium]